MLARDSSGNGGGLRDRLLRAASIIPFTRSSLRAGARVLLYHGVHPLRGAGGIDRESFRRQVAYLARRFDLSGTAAVRRPSTATSRPRLILTFDDGLKNNAVHAAAVLREAGAPAVFFVCSRHARPGRILWVSYLKALARFHSGERLIFRGETFDLAAESRKAALARLRARLESLRPHPEAIYAAMETELPGVDTFLDSTRIADLYAGMSPEELQALSREEAFEIGVHTLDHPRLSSCDDGTIAAQIDGNRRWIQEVTGKLPATMAYPFGDYDVRAVRHVERAGYDVAFAVSPRRLHAERLEIERVGVYADSLGVLAFKLRWAPSLRRLGLQVG
jgi:peptidoglycan/xylan/chitin deacetylase (PgdA/CDA1 family)